MLAHECVLPIICQMSNKNAKHPYCACAHAPSCVATGLIIPLVNYYQPKVDRQVKLEECGDCPTVADVMGVLNEVLQKEPDFAEVPDINGANEIFMCKAYSAPAKRPSKEPKELDHTADPYETPLEWHDIGEANLDPAFLFPETENSKRPINKNFRKHTSQENTWCGSNRSRPSSPM